MKRFTSLLAAHLWISMGLLLLPSLAWAQADECAISGYGISPPLSTLGSNVILPGVSKFDVDGHPFLAGQDETLGLASVDPSSRQHTFGLDDVAEIYENFRGAPYGRGNEVNQNSLVVAGFRPDVNIAVGHNYVVHMINHMTTIYDKNGNLEVGPIANNRIWEGITECELGFTSDPIVLYDHLADPGRWLASVPARGPLHYAMAYAGGNTLYAGGNFTQAGGAAANHIAAWDIQAARWSTLGAGTDTTVNALVVGGDGALYAGGAFTEADGQAAAHVARWDGSGWLPLGDGLNNTVWALAIAGDGTLYAGGAFTEADGQAAAHVARWDGTQWSSLGQGLNNAVWSLAIGSDGALYAGGAFTEAGGQAAAHIARWDGTQWSAVGQGLNNTVRALIFAGDGTLYAGGDFSDVATAPNGTGLLYVARWDGTNWSPLASGLEKWSVKSLAVDSDDMLYVGGSFNGYRAGGSVVVETGNVVRWDPVAGSWSPLGSGTDGASDGNFGVQAITVTEDGRLYAGGDFTLAGGTAANHIAKWDPDMANWSSLDGGTDFTLRFYECLAISTTDDPRGSWYQYAIDYETSFPDYPKFGLWPDAYYLSTAFDGSAVALQRDRMLAGESNPGCQRFYEDAAGESVPSQLLPADVDGPPPPNGTPNYFASIRPWDNVLKIWAFKVDWQNPFNSSFAPVAEVPVDALDIAESVPQPGNAPALHSLGDRLMMPLQYRNFGTHQVLLANHSVDVGDSKPQAGIRWYELRDNGSGWGVYQQGTYAPLDDRHRWMGSIAMNGKGDIALGYSISGVDLYPSIRFTGQTAGESGTGVMNVTEESIVEGQNAYSPDDDDARNWGDYTSMMVDPVNDATFWYTNQYLPPAGSSTLPYLSRIASLDFEGEPSHFCSTLKGNLAADCHALRALYLNTNGPDWNDHTGWLSEPMNDWYGIKVAGGRVISVELRDNGLRGPIPPQLGYLDHLRKLDLSLNDLRGPIPPEMGNLSRLQFLNLELNNFSGSIPSELADLRRLKELDLSDIGLEGSIPAEMGALSNLEILDLGENELIGNIPAGLGDLASLTVLDLNLNHLSGAVPEDLEKLGNLTFMDLSDNQLVDLPDLKLKPNATKTPLAKSIEVLRVEENRLTFEDIEPNLSPKYTFSYSPQDTVGAPGNHFVNEGDFLTWTLLVGGEHNTYKWFKDGSLISSGTTSSYTIPAAAPADEGAYVLQIDNTKATDLTLHSHPIRVVLAEVVNFEHLDAGTILSEVYAPSGFGPILVEGKQYSGPCDHNAAVIFDTSCPGGACSGGDDDLGTPNSDFGGPGIDADGNPNTGGNAGSPFQNETALGKVLIVHEHCSELEDGFVEDPDDTAGSLLLVFPEPVTVLGYTTIDVEEVDGVSVYLKDSEDNYSFFWNPGAGDNGKTVTLTDPEDGGQGTASVINFDLHSWTPFGMALDNIAFLREGPVAAEEAAKGHLTDEALDAVTSFALEAAFPNPFNPSTTIRFALPEKAHVRLAVYDILGREVKHLAEGVYEAGRHAVTFEARDLPSGAYVYRLETPAGSFVRRMVLLK